MSITTYHSDTLINRKNKLKNNEKSIDSYCVTCYIIGMEKQMSDNRNQTINFNYETARLLAKRSIARRMTIEGLRASIADCQECVALGIETGRYCDEISEYRMEIARRENGRGRRTA